MSDDVRRFDSKTLVICLLAGTVGLLGGWILSEQLSHASERPVASVVANDGLGGGDIAASGGASPGGGSSGDGSSGAAPLTGAPSTGAPATGASSQPQIVEIVVQASPAGEASVAPLAPASTDVSAPAVSSASRAAPAVSSASRAAPAASSASYGVPVVVTPVVTAGSTNETWYQVYATDGSIVSIGQNGSLVANTGSATGGGIVALSSSGSSIRSGSTTAPGSSAVSGASAVSGSSAVSGASTQQPVVAGGDASLQSGASSVGSGLSGVPGGSSINGYEDHSLHVVGDNQLVTYDDSNVFIDHNGPVNANTGDTDTSGLNAVDVTDSVITSGDSGDSVDSGDPGDSGDASSAETSASGSEGMAAQPSIASGAATGGGLTIGGDGYDDVSVTSQGNNNVVTEDDSNVVIGGTGSVNAQVGDSDTGGVVAMAVSGSTLTAGCSGTSCAVPGSPGAP
ncbi:hypothetical protein [Subtercola endophyticus]|uniref:hypothetical protein n=1 Tax=Subtercola endophyticus TaxID=2895559 RepID=UPI001E28E44A|nr:hypothetical protein [Subtercola endophyticus]UFS57832.1 hypothetical protein LQ955_12370 [Subtercola endophyticus]